MEVVMTGAASTGSSVFVTLACILVVILYAYNRYDTPDTNRLSTTRSLFIITGICYILSSLAMFFILSEVVLKPGVLPLLGLDDAQKLITQFSAPPILAAVILTTLLPNTPVVSTADQALLKIFQNWGRIPHGVRHLADRLTLDKLGVPETKIAELRDWISRDDDVPNQLKDYLGADLEEPSGWMTRVMRLYKDMEDLSQTAAYADSFSAQREIWDAIHKDFRVFTSQSHAFFVLFDSLKRLPGNEGENALKQPRGRYKDTCAILYRRLTECFAQILIMTENSDYLVDRRLRLTGFDLPAQQDEPLPIGPFVFMAVVLTIAIFGFLAIGPVPPKSAAMPLAVTAVLIAATKTIGAAAAVLPKLRWPSFRRGDSGPPYLAWVACALAAGAVSFVFERLALAVAHGTPTAATNFIAYHITPLAPTSFIICLAVAILCDVDFNLGTGLARRFKEGLICGMSMVIGVFICIRLLDIQSATAAQTAQWFPFAFSFSLGLIAGFFAPYLYREARHEEPKVQIPHLASFPKKEALF
jgi:hypothetical protein